MNINNTKIIILGGLGEVGKNMYCVMHENELIIIDAGIMFPDGGPLGVDYVLPDISFLKENESKIKALFITHGHEAHIGAIPYLAQEVNTETNEVIWVDGVGHWWVIEDTDDWMIGDGITVINFDMFTDNIEDDYTIEYKYSNR